MRNEINLNIVNIKKYLFDKEIKTFKKLDKLILLYRLLKIVYNNHRRLSWKIIQSLVLGR